MEGVRAPLFDRVSGAEAPPALDSRALRDAVIKDLSRLLNTRSALRGSLRDLAAGTVLDYGIPDFSPLNPASDSDQRRLAGIIAEAIRVFEPRLSGARVVLRPSPADPRRLLGAIAGSLVLGIVNEPVTFHMAIDIGNEPAVTLS